MISRISTMVIITHVAVHSVSKKEEIETVIETDAAEYQNTVSIKPCVKPEKIGHRSAKGQPSETDVL
jgi:hypothetical protein